MPRPPLLRRALFILALLPVGVACKPEPSVNVPAPEPEPEPEPPQLWFDENTAGDFSAGMRQLDDRHFADFDGLKAPHMPASRIEMSWEQREKVTVSGDSASHERRVERCLFFQLPKATLELYEPFFGQAIARNDTLRRSPKTVVWERAGLGQSGEFIAEEIMMGLQSLGPGLSVQLCGARDLQSGVNEMLATLEADWRLRPASELAGQVNRPPDELSFVSVGKTFETEVVFDLYDAAQLNALRGWLRGRSFTTDATERVWTQQVGSVKLIVEVSDWSRTPVEATVRTESELPVI